MKQVFEVTHPNYEPLHVMSVVTTERQRALKSIFYSISMMSHFLTIIKGWLLLWKKTDRNGLIVRRLIDSVLTRSKERG